MSHEITLEQAAERTHQVNIISRLMASHPHALDDWEIEAMSSLIDRLSGSVSAWFLEEQAQRGRK